MTVWLVGAGPGDPGLVTVRGAAALARADVVVYDRLVAHELLDLAPAHAERVSVAKAPGQVTMPQEEISALLVARGRAGDEVVRLKGGDPFVFARGGEEARALEAAGVAYEVVPGVTSAIAVPAYAGIPVTLRHSSTAFTVITGHEDPTKDTEIDWRTVARLGGTIVVLMGTRRLSMIVDELLAGGLAPETPAAAVSIGTRTDQRTVRTTLAALPAREIASPSVVVIGKVAAEHYGWFESRPLLGRRVVVTRAPHQAGQLADRLWGLGAEPLAIPVIDIDDPSDGGAALRAAVADLAAYDWVVLTSANGVDRLMGEVPDARAFGRARIAAIGPGTAAALGRHRVVADLVPERQVAEGLLEALPAPPPHGGRVLLARAEIARATLPEGLRAAGWEVDDVPAYRTVTPPVAPDAVERARAADAVCFTSGSTVVRFLEALGHAAVPPVVACIGPATAESARAQGLRIDVVPEEHTVDGLAAALAEHLGARAAAAASSARASTTPGR